MKALIYGLNGYREIIENSLYPEIDVYYSDSFAKITHFNDCAFIKAQDIPNHHFDIIIIAIKDLTIARAIKGKMIELGIALSQIWIFEELYSRVYGQKVDRVLEKVSNSIKGVVLGISHAVCGIDTNFLKGYVNLACRSQDIFYNKEILEYFVKKTNENKAVGRKNDNVIIEMYDYNYFNYDVSLIANAVEFYYSKGGFNKLAHNFNKNIHYEIPFEKMKIYNNLNELDEDSENVVKSFFDVSKWVDKDYTGFDKTYTKSISVSTALPARKFCSGLIRHRYDGTIAENIRNFKNLCMQIKGYYPNAKISVVLIPRFYTMEYALQPLLVDWKREFYNIIDQCQIDAFLDYKNLEDISKNEYFYNDVNHLNNIGALAFSQILKEELHL